MKSPELLALALVSIGGVLGMVAMSYGEEPSSAEKTPPADKQVVRLGIIGLDTSHAGIFTRMLNQETPEPGLEGFRVVVAYPGGSPDVEASHTRVEGFTKQIAERGVEIVDSIEALLERCDAVLLESVDGRRHLEQVRPVIAAGKPVFVDKPVAGSLADAIEIYRLAAEAKVPIFSSSSLRFAPAAAEALAKQPEVIGVFAHGPCALEPHHPDLYWYGIHGCEMIYALMGTGCEKVTRVQTPDTEIVTGVWKDGRVATFRGQRSGKITFGGTVFGGTDNIVLGASADGYGDLYKHLLLQVTEFFRTGKAPVSPEQTIELMAFMEAADESKRQGGVPVSIESVMSKAQAKAEAAR